jgi:hypothetical protein
MPSKDAPSDVMVQGFVTPEGKKILLVNKANSEKTLKLASELEGAASLTVDEQTGDEEPRAASIDGEELTMAPFAVTVLKLKQRNAATSRTGAAWVDY